MADIVVGYDGSPHSLRAVEAAANEARHRAGRLHIVYVYEPAEPRDVDEAAGVTATTMWAGTSPERDEAMLAEARRSAASKEAQAEREARNVVDRMVRGLGDTVTGLDVATTVTPDEKAAEALVKTAADGAQLLVVGSRGLGGVRGLLGSVSQHCVRHAPCSVLVVRPR